MMLAAAPVDTGPVTLGYVLSALAFALFIAACLLLMLYMDSDTHRRRVDRVRKDTKRRNR